MAKIHVNDLLVLNRPELADDGSTQYRIRSYTGQDYKESVQEVIDDNKLGDQFVYMDGDTMYGPLTIDVGIDPLEEENPESLTVYGKTTQTQVVISPIVISEELSNPSLVFTNTDPLYDRKRNHDALIDTTLTFRKYEGNFENASDILTLTGATVFSPVPFRVGTEIATSESLINPDGTAVFESVVIRQTDPGQMSEDNLVHKAFVDERLETVEEELISLVTVNKTEDFRYVNGNQEQFINPVSYNWVSILDTGSVLRVALDPDAVVTGHDYQNGFTYETTTNGAGQGLTVIVSEVNGVVVGVSVDNPGHGYTTLDDVSLVLGGLEVDIVSVASGSPYESSEGLTAVSDGQFRWELGKGATDETWGEIETFYLSPTDDDGTVQDVDQIFPPGHFIDIKVDGLEAGDYYARYEIVNSRVGPSLEVDGIDFEVVNEVKQIGSGYSQQNNVFTTAISGQGEGLTINILRVDPDTGGILGPEVDPETGALLQGFEIDNPGTGYVVGDTVEIEGGVVPAVFTITSIEDTLPVDKQNLMIVGVQFTGSNFASNADDEPIPVPDPTGVTAYEFEVKRRILNRPAIDGYFNWFFADGADQTFDNINKIRYASVDRDLINRSNLDFPVGSLLQLTDTTEEQTLYAQYTINSSRLDTISIADPVVEGALITHDYIELDVQVSSVESDILPEVVSESEFISTVVVSTPILDEMELETQRVNNKFDSIDNSLINIRDDIEALENAITAGAQGYQTPLINLSEPPPGKFYFYKADNVATPFFNDPSGPVVGAMLTPFDAASGGARDWAIGLQANESVLIATNVVDDTNATYLITGFEPFLDGDETIYYQFDLQFISGTPHPSTSTTADVINFKTRLLNDGISRQEAEESYVSVTGDFIIGDLKFRDSLNDTNVVEIEPENKIFRVGRTSADDGFTFKSYGLTTSYTHNDVVYEEVTSTTTTKYTPLVFAGADNNYISGLDTPEDTNLTYAANVDYVQTYVQEYVGDVVGLVTPASKTKLGPVKLDKAGILSQDDDNQLVLRKATLGNGIANVGVAGYNSSHFTATDYTAGDGTPYTRINAKVITNSNKTGYGMVQLDGATIQVNSNNMIYARHADLNNTGVMKLANNTSSSTPSWNNTTYDTIAASARALYKAHDLASDAYRARFTAGMGLHTDSSSAVKVGGIYRSGNVFYLKVT